MNNINKCATDEVIDALGAAYQAEFDLWTIRRVRSTEGVLVYDKYELIRRKLSGRGEFVYDEYDCLAPIKLTKREASTYTEAESWLNTYRVRAAMRAALEVL